MGVFTLKGYFLKASVTGGAGRVFRSRCNLPCSLEKSRNSSAKGSHRVVYRQPPCTTLVFHAGEPGDVCGRAN
jgi:hypothetical protein